MTAEETMAAEGAQVVKDPTTGMQFSVAVHPSSDVEAILELQDPDNEVFHIQEINVGNQEFTMGLGRSQAT